MSRAIFLPVCLIIVIFCTSHSLAGQEADNATSYLDQAKELYKEGPSKAQDIIKLLEKELEINPDNAEAAFYIAITDYGIGEHEKAVEYFTRANELYNKAGAFHPKIHMHKAKSLCFLGRFVEAWRTISPLSAFYLDDEESLKEYDCFLRSILDTLNIISTAKAYSFIDQRENSIPDKYFFRVIDHSNIREFENDSLIEAFINVDYEPIYSIYWCHVLLMPHEIEKQPLYCAYYISDSLKAFVKIPDYEEFYNLDKDQKAKIVKQRLEQFD